MKIIIINAIFFISFFYLFVKKNIDEKKTTTYIENIKSIVPPTIKNEQTYMFVKASYLNISFSQYVRSHDFISDTIKKFGRWEECQNIYDIWSKTDKDGIYLDIGANIGSCSFLFAEAGVKVIAFEPLPNNLFPFTVTAFSNSKYKKLVTIYPYALGKVSKKRVINIRKNNWGSSSMYYNHTDYKQEIIVKKLNDFDKIIPNKISMMKIDVEGGEYDLLLGSLYFLKNHLIECMYIEVSCGNGFYDIDKLFQLLGKYGYKIYNKRKCISKKMFNIIVKLISK